ncbi:MAG TPA: hypothetical protein VIM06_01530 [Rhodanobacter sp.]
MHSVYLHGIWRRKGADQTDRQSERANPASRRSAASASGHQQKTRRQAGFLIVSEPDLTQRM